MDSDSSSSFLLSQDCFDDSVSFFFQFFKIINPSSVENAIGFFMNNFICLHMFFFKIIFYRVLLIYNVLLVSAVQQISYSHTYVHSFFKILFLYKEKSH